MAAESQALAEIPCESCKGPLERLLHGDPIEHKGFEFYPVHEEEGIEIRCAHCMKTYLPCPKCSVGERVTLMRWLGSSSEKAYYDENQFPKDHDWQMHARALGRTSRGVDQRAFEAEFGHSFVGDDGTSSLVVWWCDGCAQTYRFHTPS